MSYHVRSLLIELVSIFTSSRFCCQLSGAAAEVVISGDMFGDQTSSVSVNVSGVACVVKRVTNTRIACDIGTVPAGKLLVKVAVQQLGLYR